MEKEYKKNIDELNKILHFLDNDDYDLDTANKKVEKGLTTIQKCLDMLDKPAGDIKIVTMKAGKLTFKNFDK